jgi:sporulation protein YlmC with PRC-barrel domain
MKSMVVSLLVTSVIGLGAAASHAQTGAPSSSTPSMNAPATHRGQTAAGPAWSNTENLVDSRKLVGAHVRNAQGKDIGQIDELLVDPKDGKISQAVVGIGGLAGIGAKKVVVPWSDVHVSMNRTKAIVNIEQATLDSAPRYERQASRTDHGSPSASPATGSGSMNQDVKPIERK